MTFKTLREYEKIVFNEYTDIVCSVVEITSDKGNVSNHLKIEKLVKDNRGYLKDSKQIFLPIHSWELIKNSIPSSPGSVVQVREIANEFLHISKSYGITTFLVGHITKTGELAGPRLLEHLVDVVFDFEGERHM